MPGTLSFFALAACLLLSGCIVSDDSLNFYVAENGTVDIVAFYGNIRSDGPGAKGAQEEKEWLDRFKAGGWEAQERLRKSATNVSSWLVKDTAPFAAALRGSFASLADLARHFELEPSAFTLTKQGKRQVFRFTIKPDPAPAAGKQESSETHVEFFPQVRFIPTRGKVVKAEGLRVMPRGRSCELDVNALMAKLDKNQPYEGTCVFEP